MPAALQTLNRIRSGGPFSDVEFDEVYPDWIRALSDPHWTPVLVARRAANLLTQGGGTRILDIGSGVGKFCILGALTTRATFYGIEQRANLVEIAALAARRYRCAGRTFFVKDDVLEMDWSAFDGYYLFNPFYEQVSSGINPMIDDTIQCSAESYSRNITATYVKLCAAKVGARVVTYHGYGGLVPPGFEIILEEPAGSDYLELWEKRDDRQGND